MTHFPREQIPEKHVVSPLNSPKNGCSGAIALYNKHEPCLGRAGMLTYGHWRASTAEPVSACVCIC